jgi:branched-chain amino acid transport system ATP-binding protein
MKQNYNRAMTALERVYAGALADRRASTLAYPDTKRVAIARCILSEPKGLMLDEPAGGLSSQDIEWMNGLIKSRFVYVSADCRTPHGCSGVSVRSSLCA